MIIRKAKKKDLIGLGDRLRQEDKDEIAAGSGLTPQSALYLGWKFSYDKYVVEADGQVEMIFGAVPGNSPNSCVIWLLSSDWISKVGFAFAKQSRPWLSRLMKNKEIGYNWVDVRNMAHIRWLDWMGAEFPHLEPMYGHEQRPFLLFMVRKP